jgi:hypothetical protein
MVTGSIFSGERALLDLNSATAEITGIAVPLVELGRLRRCARTCPAPRLPFAFATSI